MELTFWSWLATTAIMVGMEVIMPGAMFLWIGIAAGFTSLVVLLFPGMHWLAQSVLFGVAAVVSVVVSTRYFPAKEVTSDDPNLNNRMQRHVGHIGVVETAIINGRGRLKLGDTSWAATGPDMPEGTSAKITGIKDDTFVVEKI